MNKTIIINIGGTIFHIEEDAYELLKNYMTEVKRSLSMNTDSFEIITDIENRFAELFSHFLQTQNKQVIVADDVKVVMAQMGNPSDFNTPEDKEAEAGPAKNNFTSEEKNTASSRRLFRDPDDKIIGGVCSGVAHYFDVDPVWIRLTLGLLFFLGGISFIPYVIFWIAVPMAKTRADRIAMKGGVVNLDSLRQSFENEVKDLGQRADQWRKQNINPDTSARVKSFFGEVFEVIGNIIMAIIKVAGVFFAGLFLFIGGVLLISFFVAMMALLFRIHSTEFESFPLNVIPQGYRLGVILSASALVLIPLLLLFVLGLRIVFKRISVSRPVVQSLAIIWFLALGFGIFYASEISGAYRHHAKATQEISILDNPHQAYRIQVNENLFSDSLYKKGFLLNDPSIFERRTRFGLHFGGDYEDDQPPHHVYFHIEKSNTSSPYLKEEFTALGPNYESAVKTATEIVFPFEQKDSILEVGNRITYPANKPYRGQDANISLCIPIGYTIWMDNTTRDLIRNWYTNLDDYEFGGKSKDAYIMTEDGLRPKFGVLKPKPKLSEDENQSDLDKPEKPELPEKPENPDKTDSL